MKKLDAKPYEAQAVYKFRNNYCDVTSYDTC